MLVILHNNCNLYIYILGHIHIAIGNEQGQVIGGHAMSTGNIIYTTAEITLMSFSSLLFTRKLDIQGSGYEELKVLQV